MATLDQIAARRRKDLIAAEIEARRKAAEYTMGLLAGFDPSGGAATQSVMGPDPTFSGVPGQSEFLRGAPIDSQVTPGDKETILDRRRKRDLWSQVPDMRTEEFAPSDMQPIPRAEPFAPADMFPLGDVPPIESDGLQYDIEIDGEPRSFTFDEPLTEAGLEEFRKRQGLIPSDQASLDIQTPDQDLGPITALRRDIAANTLESRRNIADFRSRRADAQRNVMPSVGILPREDQLAADAAQPTPTRPYSETIESRMGPNIRSIVGDARADEMEMDLFGPAVTPGAVTPSAAKPTRPFAQTASVSKQIERRKNVLRAFSRIYGTKDNSAKYEAGALVGYQNQIDQQALQGVVGQEWENEAALLKALIKAGASAKLIGQVANWDLVPEPGEMVWMHDLDGEKDPIHVEAGSKDFTDAVIDRRVPKSELPAEKSDNVQLVDVYKKGKDGWERVGTYEEADSRRFLDNPNYAVTQIGQITGASGDVLGTGRTERDLSKDVEDISKSTEFLTQTTDLLGDLNNLGSGVVGVTGVVGEAASKIAGQVPLIGEELEDTLAQTFTQTSSKELADFRNKLSLEVPRLIPTYTGEEGKRKTTYEVEITERLSGLKSPTATYTTVKEGLVNVIELNLFQVIRKQIMTNRRISYDVRTDEGILALGNQILKPLGLERTEELELVDRLEDFIEQQLDLNKKRRSDD